MSSEFAERVKAAYDRWQEHGPQTNTHDIDLLAEVALASVSDRDITQTETWTVEIEVSDD